MLHEIVKSLVVCDPSADSPSASLSACFSMPAGLEGEGEELRGPAEQGADSEKERMQGEEGSSVELTVCCEHLCPLYWHISYRILTFTFRVVAAAITRFKMHVVGFPAPLSSLKVIII